MNTILEHNPHDHNYMTQYMNENAVKDVDYSLEYIIGVKSVLLQSDLRWYYYHKTKLTGYSQTLFTLRSMRGSEKGERIVFIGCTLWEVRKGGGNNSAATHPLLDHYT